MGPWDLLGGETADRRGVASEAYRRESVVGQVR